jgi:hypothetical protein
MKFYCGIDLSARDCHVCVIDEQLKIVVQQKLRYWRRFSRARNLTVGHQGITLIVLILFKYLRLLGSANVDLARGNTTLVQSLLAGIFLAWLFLPISISRAGISFRGLLHLPLSLRDLFAIRIVSLIITPYSWMVGAGSLAICYPLAHAPRPWAAMTAALLFIAMSCSTGLAIAHLLNIAAWRRLLFATLLLLCAAASYVVSGNDAARFWHFSSMLPTDLVARATVGENPMLAIGWLLTLNVFALAAAWWSFQLSLVNAHRARSRRRTTSILFGLPGATGGLAAKDVRYFRRLLDPYFGLLASALCCFYLVSSDAPSVSVAWIFIVIVFIANSPLAFNSFGFDTRSGLDRYALLPASGATIMQDKNLAFVIIASVQVCPIILLASWRFGLSVGAFGLLEAVSLAAAYLAWGNWMSITLPTKMQFFRFAPASGSLPEIIAGVFFGSLPGALVVYVLRTKAEQAIWAALLILLLCGILYFFATIQSGKHFEQRREKIVRSIS